MNNIKLNITTQSEAIAYLATTGIAIENHSSGSIIFNEWFIEAVPFARLAELLTTSATQVLRAISTPAVDYLAQAQADAALGIDILRDTIKLVINHIENLAMQRLYTPFYKERGEEIYPMEAIEREWYFFLAQFDGTPAKNEVVANSPAQTVSSKTSNDYLVPNPPARFLLHTHDGKAQRIPSATLKIYTQLGDAYRKFALPLWLELAAKYDISTNGIRLEIVDENKLTTFGHPEGNFWYSVGHYVEPWTIMCIGDELRKNLENRVSDYYQNCEFENAGA